MSTLLDPLLVALIVLVAAVALWRLKRRNNKPGCSGCLCGKKLNQSDRVRS